METDVPLLNAARNMNQDALMKIFDLYSSALYYYALRITNDPFQADEIVGDAFAKLLDELSSGRGPQENLRSYLYESVYKRAIDEARRSHRKYPNETMDNESFVRKYPGAREVLSDPLLSTIQEKLSEDQRHVVILRFLEGFNLNETAKILGQEIRQAKAIATRGVAQLREALGPNAKELVLIESPASGTPWYSSSSGTQPGGIEPPAVRSLRERIESKLAGDGTTDAPPPEKKKKPKGK